MTSANSMQRSVSAHEELTITQPECRPRDHFPLRDSTANRDISHELLLPCNCAEDFPPKLQICIDCPRLGEASYSPTTQPAGKASHERSLTEKRQESGQGGASLLITGNSIMDVEVERDRECRVCHSNVGIESDCGEAMRLGCACKDDLAVAHRRCAETWFNVKGNRICEICGVDAVNVVGIDEEGGFMKKLEERDHPERPAERTEARWLKRSSVCNILISFIVAAILISWMFRADMFR